MISRLLSRRSSSSTELDSWHASPTVGMARALHQRLAHADLKVVEKMGTFFFIEEPARFGAHAKPFLERRAHVATISAARAKSAHG